MSKNEGVTRRYEDVSIDALKGAEWNVHADPKKEDGTFQGLVGSIRKSGLIQRVVVRLLPDGNLEIIDGHRRVAAARVAGLEMVPCDILIGIDDATAQSMTATANIQRLENDPILEASLIGRLHGAGKKYREIAAILGKSEKYVARRARLTALAPGWKRAVELADGENRPTVAVLELIASHEPSVQESVYADVVDEETGEVDWGSEDIEWQFKSILRKLDDEVVGFDVAACRKCPYNTATHGLLFDFDDDEEMGRCQNGECFTKKWNEATDRMIEELRNAKVKVVEVSNRWSIPDAYQATKNREPGKTVPYVYTESGVRRIVWSRPAKAEGGVEGEGRVARTREEIQAEKEEKRRERVLKQNRNSAYGKVRKAFSDGGAGRVVDDLAGTERFAEFAATYIRRQFATAYLYDSLIADIIMLVGAEGLERDYGVVLTPDEFAAVMPVEGESGE